MNYVLLFIILMFKPAVLTVKSDAFKDGEFIPAKYTCTGENISPQLTISGIPQSAKSLAIIMDDPDAPNGTFVHWVLWNIPPQQTIVENSSPGVLGKNGKNETKYTGPCPPSGVHHYHFKVYALDKKLELFGGSDKKALEEAMKRHILASGELVGLYQKNNSKSN